MNSPLRERINSELKVSMKSQAKRRMSTLRLITAAIKDRDIQNRTAGKTATMEDGEVMDILAKMIKQRRESAETYDRGGRPELADGEREEIAIIEEFLPKQLNEADMMAAVKETVKDLGADGLKDMGRVMASLKERYAGQMDFAKASAAVKDLLK